MLFVEGYACRPGIYEYRSDDGNTVTRELITEEMLKRTGAKLSRLPVTLEHPREDVSNKNWSELGVGDVDGEVVHEPNGFQRLKIAVRRKDAQDDIVTKKRRELSPGYVAKIDKRGGTHPVYGEYDAEQIDRTYNHLAIVKDARGGSRVAIRVDGLPTAEMVGVFRDDSVAPHQQPQTGAKHMPVHPGLRLRLARMGADVSRIDSNDAAIEVFLAHVDAAEQMLQQQDMEPDPPNGGDSQFPTNEDGSPMYEDGEGQPMTADAFIEAQDAYIKDLEEQLEGDAEETAMEDMEPMAEDMDIPIGKQDSAYDVALKVASKVMGQQLHPETSPDFVWGIIQSKRKADGLPLVGADEGRDAGRRAIDSARADSKRADNQQRRDTARSDGASYTPGKSLSELATQQYRSQFEKRRDAARGRN